VSQSFEFEEPDFFTVGAVGKPGERIFFLQAREKGQLITLKCEKEQVRALGDYLGGIVTKLGAPKGGLPREMDLIEPLEPVTWIVANIGVGYDEDRDRIIVDLVELFEEEEEGQRQGEEPASARLRLSREQAQAFAERASELMKGGRPLCPVCSGPMNPGGHICPRSNGHIVH
jgi:uncharacterized repeat protein (TIGR03847 family)